MIAILRVLFRRELEGVRDQIAAYPDDESPWRLLPGWSNSAGTLALHLAGNLQHFVGAVLGGTGYIRDREAEFSETGLSREAILDQVEAAAAAVEVGLEGLEAKGDPEAGDPLLAAFPEAVGDRHVGTGAHLLHLLSHTAYHLGQIDYHRRAVTGEGALVPVLSRDRLPSHEPRRPPSA
jgi:uncharacterized damage-inducible protein DinB